MAGEGGPIDRVMFRAAERRWRRAAETAGTLDLFTLRRLRGRARRLRRTLDRLLFEADGRLAAGPRDGDSFAKPPGTDWAWRPAVWNGPLAEVRGAGAGARTPIGEEMTLFHDCDLAELSFRQERQLEETSPAPFGLRLDVFGFEGSYLSLAVQLPERAAQGLRRRHLVQADLFVEVETPIKVFARLNIRHGPNTEQIVRELPEVNVPQTVEFDLAYARLTERRVERLWLDLIFERPAMNRIVLRDLAMSRRPRADL